LEEALRAAGGQRFLGLGTCLEYDVVNAGGPCVEDTTRLRPDTLYARCKLELFEQLASRGGNFAWARIFFVYGPGDRAGRLIPGMIERFSRGQRAGPTFGGLRRDYIHVDDLADQLVRIALGDVRGAINTGTGLAPSLSEIFAAGAEAFGRPELALGNDETGGQPPLIQADMGRFRREIGEPLARDFATGIGDLVS
jgi:nucleoside-diphosphate-sugar epimerase